MGIAVARPLQARSRLPRMVISASPTIAEYPSPALSPWDVVASQISALQAEDSAQHPDPVQLSGAGPHASISRGCRAAADARTFRFASPEGKRMTGKMKRMSVRRRPGLSRRRRMPVACPSRPIGRRHAPVNSQDAPVSAQCELGDTQCPASLVPQRFGPHPRHFGRHLPSVVSLAGSHLLGPALFRAADLPRHADLRTAGPVRALLRPRMGGSRGKRGPVSAEVRVRVSPNPNPNPNPNP